MATNNKGIVGDSSVPHVVRVTFLGVAGLLAKPPHPDGISQDIQQTPTNESDNSNSQQLVHQIPSKQSTAQYTTTTQVIKTSPAVNHPSLLFPLPSNLKIVASVSRSRTSRGIPSGMSKCLSNSNSNKVGNRPSPLSPSSSMTPGTGDSFAMSPVTGESIIVEKNQLPNLDNKPIKEVDISKKDSSEAMIDTISSAKKELRGNNYNNHDHDHLSPPSQLSTHKRTSSGKASINSAWGSIGGGENSISTEKQQQQQDQNEGIDNIEVIRPLSPTDGLEKRDEPPERFVAVWGGDTERSNNKKTHQKLNNKQYVNLTNSLAFEAELRPSDISPIAENNRTTALTKTTNKASTSFAPKSFCVAVGLVPDFDPTASERIDEEQSATTTPDNGEGEEKNTVSKSAELPTIAIPVGFADLVINGNETLDGKRKQIDLPLSSLTNFIGLEKNNNSFPLIELTAGGLGAPPNNNNTEADAKDTPGKRKKKSIVKRMFSRKQQSTPGDDASSQQQNVYDGTPQSIYHLPNNRPPNAKERNLFLDRFGVDPSGDAVIRIALEVFPRGSELEKVFRQKNKLRKKQAAAAASVRSRSTRGRRPPSSSTSISSQTADSVSLMDDDDELSDSDDDSIFSQSFFSLDSNTWSTWDNSTMYTDGLSSFHTMDDDESFITGFDTAFDPLTEDDKRKSPTLPKVKSGSNFFSNLFNCSGTVTTEVAGISVKEGETLATAQLNVVDTSSIASMDTERQKTTHQIKQQPGDDKQGLGNYNDDLDNLVDAVDERQRQQEGTELTLEEHQSTAL